ncbi:phosphatase PAP2-related protein [Accumulibacter sp.]|jgi:membrane-associated phospholipid phosphatase|uniref:phosphatase PAP2-related protein n=1 Tax=Accumulibacter sp. TaxID=2053492 RepID=UPI001ACA59A5|nr:phosphatase PAP2-related protein [Accumulibacter sp.]MBN8453285.1 phosphatase PAP2 family protein [Accumulibacter sp.]MBO3705996.1 phosphatase PAP2 family protein [Candidatus Accumulibacter conexus]
MPDLAAWDVVAWRLLAVVGGLVGWFVTQRLIGERRLADGVMYDQLHRMTAGGNAWLHEHPGAARAVLIGSSLAIDVVTLFVLGYALLGPNFSPFLGLLSLFALRQLSQALVALPPPDGIIWRHPGFPSLFVTYSVGNDFFFSGHTALAVYGAIQVATLGIPALTLVAALLAVVQMFLVILLRAHWTLDVLGGLFAALLVGVLSWPA